MRIVAAGSTGRNAESDSVAAFRLVPCKSVVAVSRLRLARCGIIFAAFAISATDERQDKQ